MGIASTLVAWLVPPWWSPLYPDDPGEIVVTAGGLEISVPSDAEDDAICAAVFTADTGETMTFEATVPIGETHTVDVTTTFPDGTTVEYSIVCGSGEDSVFDSGQFEVGSA